MKRAGCCSRPFLHHAVRLALPGIRIVDVIVIDIRARLLRAFRIALLLLRTVLAALLLLAAVLTALLLLLRVALLILLLLLGWATLIALTRLLSVLHVLLVLLVCHDRIPLCDE